MLKNLRELICLFGLLMAAGVSGANAQDESAAEAGEAPAAQQESPAPLPAPESSSSALSPEADPVSSAGWNPASSPAKSPPDAEPLLGQAAERDEKLAEGLRRLEEQIQALSARTGTSAMPALWWLSAVLLLVPLVAILWLGYGALKRLGRQHDELRRQRTRLEGVEECLRELPANLPRPTLDVARLADRLREDLAGAPAPSPTISTAPSRGSASTPSPDPFYHNDQWLPPAVEGPRRYLDHLREIRQTVAGLFAELSAQDDPGEALALTSWMLARFYDRLQACPEDRWRQILTVAEETGWIGDGPLSERLRQARTDEEAARTLHRALHRELLEASISHHLVLLEELRNLPDFCAQEASLETCLRLSRKVDPLLEVFLARTRHLAGYTPNYVPLFSEIPEESAHFIRNNASERLAGVYRELDLPRRRVLCVLAYGLRRERGWENEETQVILS